MVSSPAAWSTWTRAEEPTSGSGCLKTRVPRLPLDRWPHARSRECIATSNLCRSPEDRQDPHLSGDRLWVRYGHCAFSARSQQRSHRGKDQHVHSARLGSYPIIGLLPCSRWIPKTSTTPNINTFNPEPVTANNRQRGYFLSATHRWILADGGFVKTLFSAKHLDIRVFPNCSTGEMILYPEQNSGSYFEQQERDTQSTQWSQTLHLRPFEYVGRHLLTAGYSDARLSYQGQVSNLPIQSCVKTVR